MSRIALITGASRGLGRNIALALADAGDVATLTRFAAEVRTVLSGQFGRRVLPEAGTPAAAGGWRTDRECLERLPARKLER